MNIGLIAKNHQEAKTIMSLLSPDQKVHVFTRPSDPDGFLLDAVIETRLAKENVYFSQIKESSKYCFRNIDAL